MEYGRSKIGRLLASERFRQFLRFCMVGCASAATHYAIYFVLLYVLAATVAYALGYIISFVGNYFLTNYFTFHTRPTWGHFIGFAGSHTVNFALHIVLFSIFLWLGMHRLLIPIVVMVIAMLVQFAILRWIFVKHP